MSLIYSCNRDACETKQAAPGNYGDLPLDWLLVRDDSDKDLHFCSRDCLMFWAAGVDPSMKDHLKPRSQSAPEDMP